TNPQIAGHIFIFPMKSESYVVRAAGLEPSRPAKHQADNPLKTNDNFSRYRPSRLVISHNLRATWWSSQEDYLKESRHT
ncbi:hypothetical protein NKW55_16095, partial [Gluconobacter kondonii]|uniref:hypothetical protein n=1 Tax=Gluconobacter kondonii TaxID=941463 RepID=UPI00209DCA33